MNKEERFEKIEAYLNQKMDAGEARAFEHAIANDPTLAKEVNKHRFERSALNLLVEDELRKDLQNWRREKEEQKKSSGKKTKKLSRLVFLAAAAIITLVLAVWFLLPSSPDSPQALADEFYQLPFRYETGQRTVVGQPDITRTPGSIAFETGNFQDAIRKLKAALESPSGDTDSLTSLLLLAHSYYKVHQYEEAINYFQLLRASENAPAFYLDNAEWNLALAYLKLEDTGAASNVLQRILSDSGHDYFQEAKKLQRQLSRITQK